MDPVENSALAGHRAGPASVRVWDPFVRVFHWSLVGLFTLAFLTGDEWASAHELAGYMIAGLLAARIAWGVFGSRHARFADFVRSPRVIGGYLVDTVKGRAKRYLGTIRPVARWSSH